MPPFLEMRNIVKRFPGVLANDHVDLTIEDGEIHALLGENGAGKSTLMQILYGLYHCDEGEILVHGKPVKIHSPSDAIANGIGMIHQDFMLVQPFTVVENVILGLDNDNPGPLLDLQAGAKKLVEISRKYGLDIDPQSRIENLPVGVQQRVEILKLLYRNARLLILDEPTAVLTPQEVEGLFAVIRSLKAMGHSVVIITHKLHEVMAVADRVTILRAGRVVGTLNKEETDPHKLARLMVGREILFDLKKSACKPGEALLRVENLHANDDAGYHRVRGISMEICEGEILGIAGVDGNGQSILCEALMNLRPVTQGHIWVGAQEVTHLSPAGHHEAGMVYIPADRRKVGSVGQLSLAQNAILGSVKQFLHAGGLFLDEKRIHAHAEDIVRRYDIRTPSVKFEAGKLSGGNLQKLILGREVTRQPRVLICEQPSRGLDVGATEYIQQQLLLQRERGAAILLVSAELEEILALSDRIAVIYRGEFMGVLEGGKASLETVGLMMAGTRLANIQPEGVTHA